jgi:hypothetical protein
VFEDLGFKGLDLWGLRCGMMMLLLTYATVGGVVVLVCGVRVVGEWGNTKFAFNFR